MEERPRTQETRKLPWLWLAGAALVVNCACLAACRLAGLYGPLFFANLLLHPLIGLALCLPFAHWWRRQQRPPSTLLTAAGLLLGASAIAGVALAVLGNRAAMRPLLWAHVGAAALGLAGLLASTGWRRRRGPLWQLSAAGLALAVVLSAASHQRRSTRSAAGAGLANPDPAATFAGESMGGASGPFYPSAMSTRSGGRLPAASFTRFSSCGRTGCHPDVVADWSASAHHYSGLDNPWYRKSFEDFQRQSGRVAARWCGGCHTPALLASGMLDRPLAEIAAAPAATVGVSCTVCHAISRVKSSQGQADFELDPPAWDGLAGSSSQPARVLHDLAVRLDPEPHRRAYSPPPLAARAANELCAACHKAHIEGPLNAGGHFVEVMNDYEPWQSNSYSGQSMTQSIYLPPPRGCIECHMPALPSGRGRGAAPRSHRFAAANTALPALHGDRAQLAAVVDSLRSAQITLDFFALGKGRPFETASGRTSMVPPETVYAPLDRVPATLRRGESNRLDVVLRSRGVGHRFPAGKYLPADCWLELRAVDERGRVLFWSGRADAGGDIGSEAHRMGGLWLDARGRAVEGGRFWTNHATVFVNWIEPDASYVVHFRLDVPADAGSKLVLEARLNYRKFPPETTRQAFAGARPQTATAAGHEPVPPVVPVVTLAAGSLTLPVVPSGAPLPDMEHPRGLTERDRERWNDYAFALANQADYLAARQAYQGLLAAWPRYADGWATLGNLDWAVGDLKSARAELERALTLSPSLARAHFYLGLVEQNAGDHERALVQLRQAVTQYPREALIWKEIGHSNLAAAHFRDAADALAKSLAIDPQDASVQLLMAQAQQALGHSDLAARHMALFRRFRPDRAAAALGRAYFEEHIGDVGKERLARHEHPSAAPAAGGSPGDDRQ